MARKKKKTPSWIDVKKNIKSFNNAQLLELIGDLYRLSENNKEFEMVEYDLIFDWLKKEKDVTSPEAWESMDNATFWSEIKPYAHMQELVSIVEQYDPNFTILTSLSPKRSFGIRGKYIWLQKHLPKAVKRGVLFCNYNKGMVAHPEAVLIDDSDRLIDQFVKAEGNAILFPQLWNKNSYIAGMPLHSIESNLKRIQNFQRMVKEMKDG